MLSDQDLDDLRAAAETQLAVFSDDVLPWLDEIARLRAALADATREFGCDNCGSHMPAMSSVEHGSEMWCCRCVSDAELIAENEKLRAARLKPETVNEAKIALIIREQSMRNIRHLVGDDKIEDVAVALAELSRAYPEED